MQLPFVSGSPLLEAVWAVGILLVSALVAWFARLGMRRVKQRLEEGKATLLPELLESLCRPVFFLLVAEGLIIALSSLSYLEAWRAGLAKAGIVIAIVILTYALARVGGVLLSFYLHGRTIRRRARVDEGLVRFLRRMLMLFVYILGVLILLDYLNISITPIIAGLGIGGLAVALALQPLLGNFFASTQIISDRVVRVGDYIELDNGAIRGYVTDVGWRSTRIRTPYNNLVIIPNSRLAESVITNYYSPTMEVGVLVNTGVSYSSDLAQVQDVALEVAREVIEELDEATKTFEPRVYFEEFGDSNINFWIWVQANDRIAAFSVKSELIKRLKARFDREGIVINYPARTTYLHWPEGMPPVSLSGIPNIMGSEKDH